jgi:transcriptional regulator with XRE-family HTH domain
VTKLSTVRPRPLTPEEEEVRQRFLLLLEIKGWKPSEAAARMGVSAQSMSNWRSGRQAIPLNAIKAMKKASGVTADWLLFDDRRLLPSDLIRGLRKLKR